MKNNLNIKNLLEICSNDKPKLIIGNDLKELELTEDPNPTYFQTAKLKEELLIYYEDPHYMNLPWVDKYIIFHLHHAYTNGSTLAQLTTLLKLSRTFFASHVEKYIGVDSSKLSHDIHASILVVNNLLNVQKRLGGVELKPIRPYLDASFVYSAWDVIIKNISGEMSEELNEYKDSLDRLLDMLNEQLDSAIKSLPEVYY